jgi:hypothetical protein
MQLHTNKEVIYPQTLSLLKQLQADSRLDSFFLVGVIALALQIGHRLSVDLDFFSEKPFETAPLIEYLSKNHDLNLSAQSKNTVLGFIASIKVDFMPILMH